VIQLTNSNLIFKQHNSHYHTTPLNGSIKKQQTLSN